MNWSVPRTRPLLIYSPSPLHASNHHNNWFVHPRSSSRKPFSWISVRGGTDQLCRRTQTALTMSTLAIARTDVARTDSPGDLAGSSSTPRNF